jgi:5-methylthioribose kinase
VQFAGAEMIRRILGLAHNIDFEWIEDPDRRAACERPALRLGRDLLVNPAAYPTIEAVTRAVRELVEETGG